MIYWLSQYQSSQKGDQLYSDASSFKVYSLGAVFPSRNRIITNINYDLVFPLGLVLVTFNEVIDSFDAFLTIIICPLALSRAKLLHLIFYLLTLGCTLH